MTLVAQHSQQQATGRSDPIRSGTRWVRANLFGTWLDAIITFLLLIGGGVAAWGFIQWAAIGAVGIYGSAEECRAETGACWAVLGNNLGLFLFGTYPSAQRWRAALSIGLMVGLFMALYVAVFRTWWVVFAGYLISTAGVLWLLFGGAYLTVVDVDLLGGFALTLLICWLALPAALPLGVLLALARQSEFPAIKALSTVYIEIVRGLPLVVVLFLSSVVFPLFLEGGTTLPKVFRAALAICLFAAAYVAEVVRGGLQAIPKSQYEAARALGLGYWRIQANIILPQVVPISIRPLSGMYITFFKNTSLISVIGLYELTGITTVIITRPEWTIFAIETYLAIGAVYVGCCWAISGLATRLEGKLTARAGAGDAVIKGS
jgi:general L-amino acid transport system permease protein